MVQKQSLWATTEFKFLFTFYFLSSKLTLCSLVAKAIKSQEEQWTLRKRTSIQLCLKQIRVNLNTATTEESCCRIARTDNQSKTINNRDKSIPIWVSPYILIVFFSLPLYFLMLVYFFDLHQISYRTMQYLQFFKSPFVSNLELKSFQLILPLHYKYLVIVAITAGPWYTWPL